MKKAALAFVVILALGVGAFFAVRSSRPAEAEAKRAKTEKAAGAKMESGGGSETKTPPARDGGKSRPTLTAEEKAARIAKVAKDYEEIMAKAAADFGAAGAAFPGGFNAYLRQLALLEREKWKDYAAFLTERELEDLQFREHRAGKLVVQWLGDTAATDEQKRAVLRLQRAYDDKYALIFDLSIGALLTRETERQELQEQILGAVGPALFAAWLRGEGEDFGNLVRYAQASGIRPEAALEVWRMKNEFIRRRLEIKSQLGDGPTSIGRQVALVEETRGKVGTILGGAAMQSPQASGLTWLK